MDWNIKYINYYGKNKYSIKLNAIANTAKSNFHQYA